MKSSDKNAPFGNGWLTLLQGKASNPQNVEVLLRLETPEAAEQLQQAFIDAGDQGPPPSDPLTYELVRSCPVRDPFSTEPLIVSSL